MKKITLFFFIAILVIACKKEGKEQELNLEGEKQTEEKSLLFSTKDVDVANFEECLENNCPEIQVSYMLVEGKPSVAESINSKNEDYLISIFYSSEDKANAETIEAAVKNFIADYFNYKREFPESPAGYEAEVSQKILAQTDSIIVIETNFYFFTGGAHGYGATRYLNFDATSGKFLSHEDLISDMEPFTDYTEKKFRNKYNIGAKESINSKGFFFEEDIFALPENIAVTQDSVFLVYNRYEAASYAQGELQLTFPKEDVSQWLNY